MSALRERREITDLEGNVVGYYLSALPRKVLGDIKQHIENKQNGGDEIVERPNVDSRARRLRRERRAAELPNNEENIRPTGSGISSNSGYCVKCKQKRDMKNAKQITTSNHRQALQGQCAVCGTKMMKFIRS